MSNFVKRLTSVVFSDLWEEKQRLQTTQYILKLHEVINSFFDHKYVQRES